MNFDVLGEFLLTAMQLIIAKELMCRAMQQILSVGPDDNCIRPV